LLPDARALFSTDPSDTFRLGRARAETPARSLALAVFMQALLDLRRAPRGRAHGKDRNLYADTRAWFLSDDRRWPHSFAALCDLFEWSPNAVRRAILGAGWAGREPVHQLRLVRRR
jgi:hypothetical protein